MKKVLALAILVTGFVACNNEAETAKVNEDSIRQADSLRQVWVADSIANAQKAASDSLGAKVDSVGAKVDSVGAKVDSLTKK